VRPSVLDIEGAVSEAAAVALPDLGLVLSCDAAGARAAEATGKMVVSRSRAPALADDVARKVGLELVGMGSAGAKARAVVRGEADAYLHSGGQYEWDNCAPVAVAQAHGLHCSRIDGSALRYNRAEALSPDLLICHRELAEPLLGAIASAQATA